MQKLLLLIITLCPVFVFAQKDPQAKLILDNVSQKALKYKDISASFEYTITGAGKNENYSGSFKVKGQKFTMEIDETIVYCNGKTRWVYLKESNEVNVTNIEITDSLEPEERFLVDPISLFSIYKSNYKYNIQGTENIDGKEFTLIDLTPENLNKTYFKIRLWITDNNDLSAVKYFQKNGERLTLTLKNVKPDNKFKDQEFDFKESDYKDVEVIDLR